MKIFLTDCREKVNKNARRAMLLIMLFVVNLITLNTVFAQENTAENDPDLTENSEPAVSIGKIASLQSKVLNKTIPLSIHLPANYDSSKKTYPVLYMLGSHYRARFAMLASTLDYMGEGQIPEMILIGVDLPEGNRILLPTRENQDTTIPDGYIKFFETELMPHVDNKYRTAPFKVLFGASNSGFFTVYTLLNNPLLFNSYFASSPSIMVIPKVLQQKITSGPLKTLKENRSLHIIYSDDEGLSNHVSEFTRVLTDHKPENFTFKVEELVNQGHVPAMDFTQFLVALYPDFNPYENLNTLDKVTQHFDILSKRYGYEILPPISIIFNLGLDMIYDEKNLVAAEKIFQYSLQVYPENKKSYMGMGIVRRDQGQLESAKAMFEKALAIDADYSFANRLLLKLENRLSYFGEKPPGLIPVEFAPEILSPDGLFEGGKFSPDKMEYYFSRKNGKYEKRTFFVIRYENGSWGNESETNLKWPKFSKGGDTLYRGNKYRILTDTGWSKSKSLGAPFSDKHIMGISFSDNRTSYFDEIEFDQAGRPDTVGAISYSRLINGIYEPRQKMGKEINTGTWIAHPHIAPDESYLIWDVRREDGYGGSDIYISFRDKNGSWLPAMNMGDKINTELSESGARVSDDGKYLFFTRGQWEIKEDGSENWVGKPYWVDAQVIENLRPQQ